MPDIRTVLASVALALHRADHGHEDREGARHDGAGRCGEPLHVVTTAFLIFSPTGVTWRWNLSSELSRPAARPISWLMCSVGMSNLVPACFDALSCHASSDRWHSGHGVTMQSAPRSFACASGCVTSLSATFSR